MTAHVLVGEAPQDTRRNSEIARLPEPWHFASGQNTKPSTCTDNPFKLKGHAPRPTSHGRGDGACFDAVLITLTPFI